MGNPYAPRQSRVVTDTRTRLDSIRARLVALGAAPDVVAAVEANTPAGGWSDMALRAELAAIEAEYAFHHGLDDPVLDTVLAGTVPGILEWVAGDTDRATRAAMAERAGRARVTLLRELDRVAGA